MTGNLFLLVAMARAIAFIPGPVTLTWDPVTKFTDGTTITAPVTYHVYGGEKGKEAVIAWDWPDATFQDVTGARGGRCWYVTARVGGVESDRSDEVCFKSQSAPVLGVK